MWILKILMGKKRVKRINIFQNMTSNSQKPYEVFMSFEIN